MYVEFDVSLLGMKVPNVGGTTGWHNMDEKYQPKLPGIIGWNVIWLACNVCVEKYGLDFLIPIYV